MKLILNLRQTKNDIIRQMAIENNDIEFLQFTHPTGVYLKIKKSILKLPLDLDFLLFYPSLNDNCTVYSRIYDYPVHVQRKIGIVVCSEND